METDTQKRTSRNDRLQPFSGFVPVQRSDPGSISGLSLRLPNGVVIQGIDQNNLAVVSHLLRQL